MNRKIVFAVACSVAVFVAYVLFYNYNYSKYKEYVANQEAEWIARGDLNLEFYYGYVHEGFINSPYGRIVLIVGITLTGVAVIIVLTTVAEVLHEARAKKKKYSGC